MMASEPTAGVGGDVVDLDSNAHSQSCGLIIVRNHSAGVQPRWIQGDSKVGMESASLEKYIFNHRYREIRNG